MRLVISLVVFLGQLTWFLYSTAIISSLALLLVLFNSLIYWRVQNTPDAAQAKIVFLPNQKQLREQLAEQLAILELQPTHRDVLYNLSLIYDRLGEKQQAQDYLNQAKLQDPNHSLFQEK